MVKRSISFKVNKKSPIKRKVNSADARFYTRKKASPKMPSRLMRSVTYTRPLPQENLLKFNKEYLEYLIKNKKLKGVPNIPKSKPSAVPLFGSYMPVSPSRDIFKAKKLAQSGFLPKKIAINNKLIKNKKTLKNIILGKLLEEGVTPADLERGNYPEDILNDMSFLSYPNKGIGEEELRRGKIDLRTQVRRSRNRSNYDYMLDRGITNWREQSNNIGIVPKGKWHRLHPPSTRFVKSKISSKSYPSKRLIKSDRTSKEDRLSLRKKRGYYSRPRSI